MDKVIVNGVDCSPDVLARERRAYEDMARGHLEAKAEIDRLRLALAAAERERDEARAERAEEFRIGTSYHRNWMRTESERDAALARLGEVPTVSPVSFAGIEIKLSTVMPLGAIWAHPDTLKGMKDAAIAQKGVPE